MNYEEYQECKCEVLEKLGINSKCPKHWATETLEEYE